MGFQLSAQGAPSLGGGVVDWLQANAVIRLFRSAHTPEVSDETADYDESDFPGYEPQAFPSLASVVVTAGNVLELRFNAVSWAATGDSDEEVFGYFVTDADDLLLWAEQSDSLQQAMPTADATYLLSFRLTIPLT